MPNLLAAWFLFGSGAQSFLRSCQRRSSGFGSKTDALRAIGCQELQNRLMVDRFGEQVALGALAAETLEQIKLRLRFHSFGNHLQPETVGEHDDHADDFVGLVVAVHSRDKNAVDLQSVDSEALQATER